MKDIIELYLTFLRIGAVTFGGGYAMLPILERDLVTGKNWTTMDKLRDYFAIGQCTPGIIALNVATFVGNERKGLAGSIAASLGFISSPLVLISIIAACLQNFAEYPVIQHAFSGIRVCVCVLILQAILKLWKSSVVDVLTLVMYIAILILMVFAKSLPFPLPAAALVVCAGIFGILFGRHADSDGKDVKK